MFPNGTTEEVTGRSFKEVPEETSERLLEFFKVFLGELLKIKHMEELPK